MSGTNILYLVPRSGVWNKDGEVADVYVDNMSYVYTGDIWGQKIEGLYREAIQGTDTVVRVWASNMTSQLSNHHAYEYLGGLSMAVAKLTGKQPEAFIADVRDPNGARMRDFGEVLATNLATELLNPRWIEGMKEHGYAGAGHAAELVKNTFGWSVTRKGSVSDAQWNDIYEVYVNDRYKLGLREWLETVNPHALQEMTATMLEATRKGYWNATGKTVQQLSMLYAGLAVKYGDSGGLVSGGNKAMEEFVSKRLQSGNSAPGTALAARMSETLAKAAGAPPPQVTSAPKTPPAPGAARLAHISGQKLELVAQHVTRHLSHAGTPSSRFVQYYYMMIATVAFALIAYGFALRKGAI
jgi:cobaltochelatase CobN